MAALRSIAPVLLLIGAQPVTPSSQTLVIYKQGTSEYHRPWCPVIRDGKDVIAVTLGQANGRGLKPHAACQNEPPNATGTTGDIVSARKPAAPVYVFLDATKYYHREDCAKRIGRLKRETLDVAARTYWPCPACRPPVRKKSDAPAIPPRQPRR